LAYYFGKALASPFDVKSNDDEVRN